MNRNEQPGYRLLVQYLTNNLESMASYVNEENGYRMHREEDFDRVRDRVGTLTVLVAWLRQEWEFDELTEEIFQHVLDPT